MTDKAKELAEKLLALAKGGTKNEKQSAERFLEKHLAKYGLTIEQFEADQAELTWFEFEFKTGQKATEPSEKGQFANQIVSSVIGHVGMKNPNVFLKGKGIWIGYQVTVAQLVEIQAKREFYWKLYQDEKKIFYSAFVQSNRLFALPDSGQNDDREDEDPERTKRVLDMAGAIPGQSFRKQLKAE